MNKVHQSQCRFFFKLDHLRDHTHAHTTRTQPHGGLAYYAVEIPEVDFPSSPTSGDTEQGGGGVKLASGRLLSKDGMGDGEGGSRVLLGLLMSPSPTSVRSMWVSSSTVRRLGRVSNGREIGDRWVPKVGWRGGGIRHRLVPECPLALELREESRLSERRLEVRGPLEETPFSLLGLRESGVEQAKLEETEKEEVGGVRRRKSGSTRSSLLSSPRWSLARLLCARLNSSKNSAKHIKQFPPLKLSKHVKTRKKRISWIYHAAQQPHT